MNLLLSGIYRKIQRHKQSNEYTWLIFLANDIYIYIYILIIKVSILGVTHPNVSFSAGLASVWNK